MDMNKELFSLYSGLDIYKLIDDYNSKFSDEAENTAYPLFLKANETYINSDVKLLIFGKETNGWGGTYGSGVCVDDITNVYDEFFNSGDCYAYGGQFWNGIKYFMNLLQEKNKDKKISYLWNNIVKIGYDKEGFPYNFYENIVKPYLNNIITKEIEILKPDFVLFFTGPNSDNGPYDNVLNEVFNNPQRKPVDGFTERQLCEIVIPNVKKSFRTYHPNYLYRNNIDTYFEKIINEII
jgi:hypothetical protein